MSSPNTNNPTGPAPHTLGPHKNDLANILDPKVQPKGANLDAMRGKGGDATGPAPSTIGPHKSDLANVLDPRVKPDPSKLGHERDAFVGEGGGGRGEVRGEGCG
ncbi:hypothetical protein EJ03DRAFT_350002 [Teratosphaeria nubilosa]|uniref:Uncharacterized protein n=1 Tax=Teratosphaeria nubilosa TaxID=161662 RepID=A0A6G1LDM0_9PEZI|nr:hypothetical protein EJ03DRAFT_350002 [Teratosphaeria nubilosa]